MQRDGSGTFDAGVFDLETDQFTALGFALLLPQWLPDGRRLVSVSDGKIVVFDTDSKERVDIEMGEGVSGPLHLAPDGRTLFYRQSSTEADIWLATLD